MNLHPSKTSKFYYRFFVADIHPQSSQYETIREFYTPEEVATFYLGRLLRNYFTVAVVYDCETDEPLDKEIITFHSGIHGDIVVTCRNAVNGMTDLLNVTWHD